MSLGKMLASLDEDQKMRVAVGVVEKLADEDSFTCGDCGREVDLEHADTPRQVAIVLVAHKHEYHTEGSE